MSDDQTPLFGKDGIARLHQKFECGVASVNSYANLCLKKRGTHSRHGIFLFMVS